MKYLRLISIWYGKKSQNSYINYHDHKYHELVYYPSGNGKTEIGNTSFIFSDHSFAVIPRNTEHNETHYTNSEVICLEFSGVDELPVGFYTDASHTVYKILTELLSEVKSQKYGYEDMLTIKLNELLLHIDRSKHNNTIQKTFSYIINYIQENYHTHINLAECARQLNISYDYFQHKFKTITGVSPQQFLIEQRLLAATGFLRNSNLNCTEIAYRCGFSTSAQFSSIFKRRYGITPLQFKRQHSDHS